MANRAFGFSEMCNQEVFLNKSDVEEIFIGESSFIKELRKVVLQFSKNKAAILLNGEKGTGKRLFAETLHFLSGNRAEAFHVLNCTSVNDAEIETTIESLKTDISGSSDKTLLVRNVEYSCESVQQKLLELIKSYEDYHIRVIFTMESALEEIVAQKKFCESLYFILCNSVVNFVPLRQRREDIVPLISFFYKGIKKYTGIKMEGFSQEAFYALKNNFWKGNVFELKNVLERAFLNANPPCITLDDLGFITKDSLQDSQMKGMALKNSIPLKDAIDSFKKLYLTKVLEENNWNQTKTAKILGIQRTYVIKLISDLNIQKK